MSKSKKQSWVSVGTVKDAFGLRGELFVGLRGGDSEAAWLRPGGAFRLSPRQPGGLTQQSAEQRPDNLQTFTVVSVRPHKGGVVLRLKGIEDRTAAEKLRGWVHWVADSDLVANSGETPFLAEYLGLRVLTPDHGLLGVVVEVLRGPQWDILVVELPAGDQVEVPCLSTWVQELDLTAGSIVMNLPAEFRDPGFWKATKE